MKGRDDMSHSQPDFKKPAGIDQMTAKIVAGVLAVSAAIALITAVVLGFDVLKHAFLLLVGFGALGAAIRFFTTECWRDGLTLKEIGKIIIWPISTWLDIRSGQGAFAALRGKYIPADTDTSPTIVPSERWSLGIGAVLGVVGIILFKMGLDSLGGLISGLIGIVLALCLVVIAFMWALDWPYRGGMSWTDVMLKVLFPVGILVGLGTIIWNKFRSRGQTA